jgi:Protein of unknown function (DUF2589)
MAQVPANFPQEIASFPFYATFSQILMAGVNANNAAQLAYIQNLAKIAFDSTKSPVQQGAAFQLSGPLNYVVFDSDLEFDQTDPNDPTKTITNQVHKHVKVPLIAIVDVRPMAIDKLTADLSIKLKSENTETDSSKFSLNEALDLGIDLGFLNIKSHTEISYQTESKSEQSITREYNLQVHMEASTQPLNAPLKNIIDYLIRTEPLPAPKK